MAEANIQLSLVFPLFNEEKVIPFLQKELNRHLELQNNCEIVLVNDGSSDNTQALLEAWSSQDPRVNIIHLKQNIGHQKAILEGLKAAKGENVITIDADLQDPIEMISSMVSKADEGFDVVHTQRISRSGEPLIRKSMTWLFYRLAKHIFQKSILLDAGDFRLMSRKAIQVYFATVEYPHILRHQILNLPLKQTVLNYHRNPRVVGESKFTFIRLAQLAINIILSSRQR
jgi:dolichol-phosphate mannosyltransferase